MTTVAETHAPLLAPIAAGPGAGSMSRDPFVDVAALLAGGLPEPPRPEVCRREDGCGLFYAGQVNALIGDPESGKTWISYAGCAEALAEGGRALIVDADHNGAQQVLSRLLVLGVPAEVLADRNRFRLAAPDERDDLATAIRQATEWSPTIAVVDSIGEVLPMFGASSNSPDDYTTVHRAVLLPLARAGAAVVAVDHLAKGSDSRQAGATGTAAKRRAVGGSALRVTVRDPFTPGRGGSALLSVHKDRPGGLRAACPGGTGEVAAGVFRLHSTPEGLRWSIEPATAEDNLSRAEIRSVGYVPTEADLSAVASLPEDKRTQRGVQAALQVGGSKALRILQVYRSQGRSPLPDPYHQEGGAQDQAAPGALPERGAGVVLHEEHGVYECTACGQATWSESCGPHWHDDRCPAGAR